MKNLKLASRETEQRTIVNVSGVQVGGDFVVIAGPCSVESEKQILDTARAVKAAGADMLRGGAFKPRTSPYAFQGLGIRGLKILEKAKLQTGLPIVTEVGRPVLLKRGMYSTLEEWLNCAEYILSEGNPDVILCERGIRTFETYTRNTLDLSAVPAIKELSHLPIIIDPTHSTGRISLIASMSMAAVAAGADGMMVEVHHKPEEALCDADQALTPPIFSDIMKRLIPLKSFLKNLPSELTHKRIHDRGEVENET
jgi:3-deoxy-7-phosphoheptulonate synthase